MRWLVAALLLWAVRPAAAAPVEGVRPVPLGTLDGRGQPADPRVSPDATAVGFEFLGAGGETLEVYWLPFDREGAEPRPVVPIRSADPFSLRPDAARPVSEGLSWGPPKRGRARAVVAATRRAATRGPGQNNFDLFLAEPGRRGFLTEHPANDAQPAVSPDGSLVAFVSGRTGQGDLYLYRFFAQGPTVVRLTREPAGSELYPAWSPDGRRLAYVAHLGGQDHVVVVDGVAGDAPAFRDVTPERRGSCLAPSFSPDGRWIAFYAREPASRRADLFAVPVAGGTARLLLEGGLPETRGGPRWLPDAAGLVVVRDDAARRNPLVRVAVDGGAVEVLETGTELNADPWVADLPAGWTVFWTAQGASGDVQKRWRRIYRGRLPRWERAR